VIFRYNLKIIFYQMGNLLVQLATTLWKWADTKEKRFLWHAQGQDILDLKLSGTKTVSS